MTSPSFSRDIRPPANDTLVNVIDSGASCKLLHASAVQSESAIILLRSRLLSVAQRIGFPEMERENMALVAAEMVSNQIKYAQQRGQIQIWQQPGPTLDILALDYGPGIANMQQALEDGFSSARTLGKGLGSIQRLAHEAAIYTQAAGGLHVKWTGTAVLARFSLNRKGRDAKPAPISIGLFSRALSDDRFNGDRIYLQREGSLVRWLHLDGLGHGEEAHRTIDGLASCLNGNHPYAALEAADHQLSNTRGAVAICGEIDSTSRHLSLLGVGDMHVALHHQEQLRKLSFSPGVLGREHKLATPFGENLPGKTTILSASDGIRRSWDESSFPGLFHHPPQLIAYVLGNIMGRLSDDQSLCVIGIS
ncbi:MAG: SpoIIE family protein phosphatase [Sulfuricella sp.]|nr:SpoIIE family protein phosphatase [Sulfuricella sp.]